MKFKVGQKWKSRDGRVAEIVSLNGLKVGYPVVATFEGDPFEFSFTEDGKFSFKDDGWFSFPEDSFINDERDRDLVSLIEPFEEVVTHDGIMLSPEDIEKIKIYNWLFTPTRDRPDRDLKIDRTIHRNHLRALMVFRTWGTEAEVKAAILKAINDASNT